LVLSVATLLEVAPNKAKYTSIKEVFIVLFLNRHFNI
jgi:hypothetical protein